MTRDQNQTADTNQPRAGAPLEFPTSDRGMHPFPSYCPDWCDRDEHIRFAEESEGLYSAAEISRHFRTGGEAFLPEIRTTAGTIQRRAGAAWTLTAQQELREPWTDLSGNASPPLIEVSVSDRGLGQKSAAAIRTTTGEARVLAAHIVALCDRVDLGGLR